MYYFVRHAETFWNKYFKFKDNIASFDGKRLHDEYNLRTCPEWKQLSYGGLEQLEGIKNNLLNIIDDSLPTMVYSSNNVRTIDTAIPICKSLNLELNIDDRVDEFHGLEQSKYLSHKNVSDLMEKYKDGNVNVVIFTHMNLVRNFFRQELGKYNKMIRNGEIVQFDFHQDHEMYKPIEYYKLKSN